MIPRKAELEGMALVTADSAFAQFNVPILW
jgi:hypothetical protein